MIGEKVLSKEADRQEIASLNNLLKEKGMSDGQIRNATKKISVFLGEHYLYINIKNVLDFAKYYDWGYDMDNSVLTHWFKNVEELISAIEIGIVSILNKYSDYNDFILRAEFVEVTKNSLGIISVDSIKNQVEDIIQKKINSKVVKKY
jgi:hypothetical protein